ncbi:MAG: DMT family transporter [Acidimicrobiia bacterium]|nr:DMT family transporter [Acidimicrobiia bacterium]
MRRSDLGLLVVAVVAVSISGPLIREADAPALAIAMWRNLLATAVLAGVVAVGHRRAVSELARRERRLIALSGLFLAAHFATWIPSLELTTVASSVALVCTQPVWAAGIARLRGERVTGRVWLGVGLATAGVVVLSGVDLAVSGRALAGDALALAGGGFAAAYVSIGSDVRRTVVNPVYTLGCYGVAGIIIGLLAVGTGQDVTGFDGRTWWVLVALAVGPQLLGHSVFNRVLPSVGSLVVSVSVLLEVIGAAVLAWWWFGEAPPLAAVPAAVLLLGGVFLVVTADQRQRALPAVA